MFHKKICMAIALLFAGQYAIARVYPEGAEQPQKMQDERVKFVIKNPEDEVRQAVNVSLEYAYVYIQPDRTVRLTAENLNEKGEGNIPFDGNGPMTSGITHVLNSSEIVLTKPGVYKVNFMGTAALNKPSNISLILSFGGTEPTIALFLNGQRVEGTGIFVPHKRIVTVQSRSIIPQGGPIRMVGGGDNYKIEPLNLVLDDKCPISTQAIITVNAGDILTVKWNGRKLVNGEFLDILPNTSIIIKQLAAQ